MLKKSSNQFIAFLQVTGFVIYLLILASFFAFFIPTLNKTGAEDFFAPVIMLILFVMSAVISATLLLGRAAVLFWEKNYKSSFEIILWNVIWGFVYFALFISYLYFSA